MRIRPSVAIGSVLGAAIALPAMPAELAVKLELPEITSGMYLKPYVATFIVKADGTFHRSLTLWHMSNGRQGRGGGAGPQAGGPQQGNAPGAGAQAPGGQGGQMAQGGARGEPPPGDRYLNTLRDWWRTSAATSQMPIDGVSSTTRGVGTYDLSYVPGKAPLSDLPAGKYEMVIEVAREVKMARGGGQGGAPGAGGPPGEGGPQQARGEGGAPPARGEGPPPGEGAAAAGGARGPSKDALEEVRIAFDWPVKKETVLKSKGKAELGAVTLTLKP